MRDILLRALAILTFLVPPLIIFAELADASVITIVNLDGAGEGFNDPSAPDAASAAGGNSGATLGAQRLIAFQHAADIWGRRLSSNVQIRVNARLDPLTCNATSATLGAAGTINAVRDFVGAPVAATWYPLALANSLTGTDLDPANNDIQATFNSSIGTTCAFPLGWYYGLDANPPGNALDFVSVVLHELGHGLGFQSFVNLQTGAKFGTPGGPLFDDTFSRNLEDHSTGKLYPQMTDEERVAASINTGNLHWVGANVVATSGSLTGGVHPSGHVQMFAPDPQQPGSSVSHFDTAVSPNELMEPSYTSANRDVALTVELFADLGWLILDATTSIGVYDPTSSVFFLKNTNGAGGADVTFQFGPGGLGWMPLAGDWNGDGVDTVGVYDPSSGVFFLKNTNGAGGADVVFQFGPGGLGWIPLVGDWNRDGVDTAGVYNPSTGVFFLKNSNSAGGADVVFQFGPGGLGWIPLVADWNGDGVDTVGAYNPSTGVFFLRNSNSAGGADVVFQFGPGGLGWIPLVGDWDGN